MRAVSVDWRADGDHFVLGWQVAGAAHLVVPPAVAPARADGLWQTTCFELFLADAGTAYCEFNLSPSTRWAAYRFAAYRDGMAPQEMPQPPQITPGAAGGAVFACTVRLPAALLAGARAAGLCAVIEEAGGHLSYWALAHGPGQPDFHASACFALAIGAAEAP
ncbi:MAG TPA: DOMON-like domain-containing protein [Novosphingobium sp.]|nr:DOMON-like domain-containing protein [Novosphingobium sp.]